MAREAAEATPVVDASTMFQSPRCGRCGSRGRNASCTESPTSVSKPSVRAMWLARSTWRLAESWHAFQSPRCGRCGSRGGRTEYSGSRSTGFKALGAGDVAREATAAAAMKRCCAVFQSPRCGRCGSRGGDAGVARTETRRVSKPSVRAMWLARRHVHTARRRARRCFKALGAGDVAREVRDRRSLADAC